MTPAEYISARLDVDPLRTAVEVEAQRLGLDTLAADRVFSALCGLLDREAEAAADRRLRALLRGATRASSPTDDMRATT